MTDPVAPTRRQLLLATGAAALVASVVLVGAVLPAEFGLDPLGTGHLLGFSKLHETPAPPPQPEVVSVPVQRYNVSFPVTQRTVLETTGRATAGQPVHVAVDVFGKDLLDVTATLTWMDDEAVPQLAQPDTFQVRWTDPDGHPWPSNQARNNATGQGAVASLATIAGIPDAGFVEATNVTGAIVAAHAAHPASHRGAGKWDLELLLVDAPGGAGLAPDGANAWSLKVASRSYELAVGAPTLTGRVHDSLDVTIRARSSVEFKMFMQEGATVTYQWTAGSALAYDFHGDRAADAGQFTSHEQGSAATRSGDFRAPFEGRHGWYWRNDAYDAIHVHLELEGAYRIIGLV